MYLNITMRGVRVTVVVTETQQCILCVLLSSTSLSATLAYCVLHNNAFMESLHRRQQ